jgi:hypothetical protein
MRCAICHHAIQPAAEPVVSTMMGDFVHISCADREAGCAYRWRTFRAAISATLVLGLLGLALQADLRGTALLALLLFLLAGHVRLNERWWRVTMRVRRRRTGAGAK